MDAGTVAEIGAPSALLARPHGAFSSLVDRTGAAGAAALRQVGETAGKLCPRRAG